MRPTISPKARLSLVVAVFFLFVGGVASCAPAQDSCEQASAHVADCFGTELSECDPATAETLLAQSCEEIASSAEPGKADGFCPSWLWWLCADVPVRSCPAAGIYDGYDDYSSAERMNYHWEWAACTEFGTGENPPLENTGWDLISDLGSGVRSSLLFLGRAFTNETDHLDAGRVKLLHPYGTLTQITYTAGPPDPACFTEYTGIFSETDLTGLSRFSLGADPVVGGYLPGIALKFFVEGQASVNLLAIRGMEPDANFFSQTISNVVPPPESTALQAVLAFLGLFADDASRLRLEHVARWHSDGTEVAAADIREPYEFIFEPTAEAVALYQAELDANPDIDFRAALGAIPPGTSLYKVSARETPDACVQELGELSTATEFRASLWGDRFLQFQHPTEEQGFD